MDAPVSAADTFSDINEGYHFHKGVVPVGPRVWIEPLDKEKE
jgi:hypothetical protein